jgi:hypothetical protein
MILSAAFTMTIYLLLYLPLWAIINHRNFLNNHHVIFPPPALLNGKSAFSRQRQKLQFERLVIAGKIRYSTGI